MSSVRYSVIEEGLGDDEITENISHNNTMHSYYTTNHADEPWMLELKSQISGVILEYLKFFAEKNNKDYGAVAKNMAQNAMQGLYNYGYGVVSSIFNPTQKKLSDEEALYLNRYVRCKDFVTKTKAAKCFEDLIKLAWEAGHLARHFQEVARHSSDCAKAMHAARSLILKALDVNLGNDYLNYCNEQETILANYNNEGIQAFHQNQNSSLIRKKYLILLKRLCDLNYAPILAIATFQHQLPTPNPRYDAVDYKVLTNLPAVYLNNYCEIYLKVDLNAGNDITKNEGNTPRYLIYKDVCISTKNELDAALEAEQKVSPRPLA